MDDNNSNNYNDIDIDICDIPVFSEIGNDKNDGINDDFVDISSSSPKSKKSNVGKEVGKKVGKKVGQCVEKYGNGLFKHMGGIIKFIAFLICFSIIIVSFFAAYFFYSNSTFGKTLSLSIIGGGTAVALIFLFMIYGVGHIVSQNNAILTRLNEILKKK